MRHRVVTQSATLLHALRALASSLGCVPVDIHEQPDIVLFDWTEAADSEQIDALKRSARAVIAVCAQERRDEIEQARAAGLEHYILKPVRRRSLIERIELALGGVAGDEPKAREQSRPLAGLRVLLAEDNPINALLARTLLTREGCLVSVVQDGQEAVDAAATGAYDLILLDIRMPRLDGLEAAQRIRAGQGPSAQAPIVALTADAGETERVQALQAGMDDFITKPIDATRLLAVAERFTGRPNPATFAGE